MLNSRFSSPHALISLHERSRQQQQAWLETMLENDTQSERTVKQQEYINEGVEKVSKWVLYYNSLRSLHEEEFPKLGAPV